jgi:hypothetical protein
LQRPRALPEDPGPGDAFLRVSVARRPVRMLAAAIGEEPSAALRRLIAGYLELPAAKPVMRIASSAVQQKPMPRVELLTRPMLPAAEARAQSDYRHCSHCDAMTRHERVGGEWRCVPCRELSEWYWKAQEQAVAEYERQRRALQERWWGAWPSAQGAVHTSSWPGHEERGGLAAWWQRWSLLIIGLGLAAGVMFGRAGLLVVGLGVLGGLVGGSEGAVLSAATGALIALLRKSGANPVLKAQAIPVSEGFVVWLPRR